MEFLNAVRQTEFLQGIPEQWGTSVLELAEPRDYSPGSVLFTEGTVHEFFHLVIAGHVRLEMSVPRRGRILLLTTGPGDVLAWSAILAEGVMTATGTALEPVRTAAFRGSAMRQLFARQPEIGYHVFRQLANALSRRLVATRLQLLDLYGEQRPVSEPSAVDPEC